MNNSKLLKILIFILFISNGLLYFSVFSKDQSLGGRTNSSLLRVSGDYSVTGKMGIGTTTPVVNLTVQNSSATTTVWIESATSTKGACLKLKDADGVGYTYCSYNNGTQTCATTACY